MPSIMRTMMVVSRTLADGGRPDGVGTGRDILSRLRRARERVRTDPSEAQRDAGNFRKGRLDWKGFELTIENPKGSTRRGKSADGSEWSREMRADYGYFRGTEGKDGDHLDFFMGPDPDSDFVYVVNQVKPDSGRFDEHKVVLGCSSVREARELYLSHYPAGWKGLEGGRAMTVDDFREWSAGDLTKRAGIEQDVRRLVDRCRESGSASSFWYDTVGGDLVASDESPDDVGGKAAWFRMDGRHPLAGLDHSVMSLLRDKARKGRESPQGTDGPAGARGQKEAQSGQRTLLQHLGWIPGESGLGRFASPMTAMLATGLLGAGLGYGGGKLLEQVVPDTWEDGKLTRSLALLGGLGGMATPAVVLGLPNVDAGKGLTARPVGTDGPEDRVAIDADGIARPVVRGSEAGILSFGGHGKAVGATAGGVAKKAESWSSGLGGPPPGIDVDRFLNTLWSDPDVARRVPPDIQMATTGLLQTARRPGQDRVGMADIGRIAAGMGAGWAAGALVGKTLGMMAGLPEDQQATLRQTGVWAGVINSLVPRAFGVEGD